MIEVTLEATGDLEEEASQESAFDPETNTINWDCPCLGGMAHGPCGEEFKKAFSCFVFSEQEPKGIDCVENFKGMQDCFRKYPDHYKEELEDEDEFEKEEAGQASGGSDADGKGLSSSSSSNEDEDEGVREFRREMNKE
jgi:intermembrane space import and assembly protein 40